MVWSRVSAWLLVLGATACGNSESDRSTGSSGASGLAGMGADTGGHGANGGATSTGGASGANASGGDASGGTEVGGATSATGGAGASSGGTAGDDNGGGGGSGANGGNGTIGGSDGAGAGGSAAQAGVGGNASGGTGVRPPPTGPVECMALATTGGRANAAGGGGGGSLGGATGACTISAESTLAAIPTVGIVTFALSGLSDVSNATIDFVPASGGTTLTAPVNLTAAGYRTLLLGMKANTRYAYRVSVTGSSGTCTSPEYTLQTGAVPSDVPKLTVTVMNAAARAKGFIVATTGTGLGEGAPREHRYAYIVDSDGDPVWWAEPGVFSAHMSWDGQEMYMLSGSTVLSVSMDGSRTTMNLVTDAHHDVTAIPGGLATLVGASLVERASDGTLTTVVADMATLYQPSNQGVHTNALHYYAWDDGYTISDSLAGVVIKVTRQGELVWEIGGRSPQLVTDLIRDPAKYYRTAQWSFGNHGHQHMPDGTFVMFHSVAQCSPTTTFEIPSGIQGFQLDPTNMNANALFRFGFDSGTEHFGDVQRLPNGNYLATFSESGRIVEFTAAGAVVATFVAEDGEFGYGEFRESLYGPPPY